MYNARVIRLIYDFEPLAGNPRFEQMLAKHS